MSKPIAPSAPSLAHRPVIMGDRGMVVAGHHRAAEAGLAMLRANGNAMDAAIATASALAIAIPFMNGLGGDCIALYAQRPNQVTVVNGSGATARNAAARRISPPGDQFHAHAWAVDRLSSRALWRRLVKRRSVLRPSPLPNCLSPRFRWPKKASQSMHRPRNSTMVRFMLILRRDSRCSKPLSVRLADGPSDTD